MKQGKKYWHKLGVDLLRDRWLYALILPGFIWFLIYRYLPMAGLSLAFQEYDMKGGLFGGEFVGLKYF